MDPYVELARAAIEAWVREGRVLDLPEGLPEEMRSSRRGVFVCLKKGGHLRGCMGTFLPTRGSVAEEVVHNAIASCSEDPRFPPVREEELPDLEVSVDVLSSPEEVDDLSKLDPRVYGVIVEKGGRRGLLLPDLEGVDTVEEQLAIAMRKAGIVDPRGMRVYRFTVRRHG